MPQRCYSITVVYDGRDDPQDEVYYYRGTHLTDIINHALSVNITGIGTCVISDCIQDLVCREVSLETWLKNGGIDLSSPIQTAIRR